VTAQADLVTTLNTVCGLHIWRDEGILLGQPCGHSTV